MTKAISPLVTALGMEPHPEGGWYKEMWKAHFQIPKPVLPDVYSGPRLQLRLRISCCIRVSSPSGMWSILMSCGYIIAEAL